MDERQIASFVKTCCEPFAVPGVGTSYRCAAYLRDKLYLPCVVIASKNEWLELALRRFEETSRGSGFLGIRPGRGADFRSVVEVFVASGNRIDSFDIERMALSDYALSAARLEEIGGETSMSWTQFVAVMRDGKEFSFGTSYNVEFFDMPPGYTAADVVTIRAHERNAADVFRDRPFFTCYIDGLV